MAEQEQNQPEEEIAGEQTTAENESRQREPGAPEAASGDAAATPQEGADEAAAAPPEEPGLEEMVSQLQEDLLAAKDSALRAQADAQNAKRRAEQDVEKARKFALEGFSKELLHVVDNLERALEAVPGDDEAVKPIAEGIQLTLKSFMDVMARFNIEQVDPQGEPFDPNLHQAMSMMENPEVEPNTVIAVVQKGYVLNGRLMRPAMVMVSKNGG